MKILIVDDNKENLYLLETLLTGKGYEAVSAKNGVEALERLKNDSIDMIISDILMPKMDGFQLCRECKTDDTLKKIPFVFYTATYTDKKDEEFALSLGAEKFIVKPIEPERFIEMIKEVLENFKKGMLPLSRIPPKKDEAVYLKEYNERLIIKLEDKMLELEKANHELVERIKEINCLYGLSQLTQQPGISLEGIFQGAVDLVLPAWQYPDIACARIIFEGKEPKTDNFKTTKWKQSADIKVHGEIAGSVEVNYLEEKPVLYEGPFLKGERDLIEDIAERLGGIAERKKAQEEIEKHLHDLEVFYKANIGREERVLELKKKIKELEEKLGKKSDNE